MSDSTTEKYVYIRRLPLSNIDKNSNAETRPYFDQAARQLGSAFVKDSIRPHTGMTLPIENLLMPEVIDILKDDREFKKGVINFFHEIYLKIPSHDPVKDIGGYRLNIALEDNDKPVSKDNLPHAPVDYVKYLFAKTHPLVAPSEEEGRGNLLKEFYIYDPESVAARNVDKGNVKDEALTAYLKIKDNIDNLTQLLVVMNVPREEFFGKEKELARKQAELRPEEFLQVTKDAHIENKALLKQMVDSKIIERAGDRFQFVEGKKFFAGSPKEAIMYLKDPANSEHVLEFKARVKAYNKVAPN